MLGVHVDDNLSLVLDRQTYADFKTRWSQVFTSSQTTKNPREVSFAGLNFRRVDERTISIGGGEEIMDSLAAALDSARSFGAWPAMLYDEVPMAGGRARQAPSPRSRWGAAPRGCPPLPRPLAPRDLRMGHRPVAPGGVVRVHRHLAADQHELHQGRMALPRASLLVPASAPATTA